MQSVVEPVAQEVEEPCVDEEFVDEFVKVSQGNADIAAVFYAACATVVHASTRLSIPAVALNTLPETAMSMLDLIEERARDTGHVLNEEMRMELINTYKKAQTYATERFAGGDEVRA
jgi:hypothetical protein